ncbi:MAG TPA: ester cyclase [Anaerolineales bacterium]|nr:ester cyclase [Anaerolineales bacterium]
MSTDLATFADVITHAWNSHDIEKVLAFYSSHYIAEDVGQAFLLRGHEGVRAMLDNYWQAFPDLEFTVTDTVTQDSRMTIVWMAEGTHQGTIMNIPPTGHRVAVRGVSILDVEDGLIIRGQSIWDLAGMLRHMGLLPEL